MDNFQEFCGSIAAATDIRTELGFTATSISRFEGFPQGNANWYQVKTDIDDRGFTPQNMDAAHDLWKSWLILREWLSPVYRYTNATER